MHPSTTKQDPRAVFLQAIADMGIQDVHGVEMLRLIKMAANAYDIILADRMREEEVSEPRWRMLLRLWMEEQSGSETLSPTQLSHAQRLSKNTISAHLRALEEQGFIARQLDADDLRQFRIRLTDSGRDLIRRSTPGHMTFLNQLTADLSPSEVDALQQLLHKLHRSIWKHSQLEHHCMEDGPTADNSPE
ncbi:MAG: MarR family transcriptional regulator [Caldilineaceae bacterium]|nr:MarR family transcriptional regulator [Caldilineaceae bacterium]